MTVGIIGLGLIGGSMARAYKAAGHTVFGFDINSASLGYAVLSDIIDNELTDDKINECELIFIALYPEAAEKYLEEKRQSLFLRAVWLLTFAEQKEEYAKRALSWHAKTVLPLRADILWRGHSFRA